MKKLIALTLAAFLAAALFLPGPAQAVQENNLLKDDPRTRGLVAEALSLADGGLLLLGESEYGEEAWMARTGADGSALWVLWEDGGGVFRHAREMPGGGFAALIQREPDPKTGSGEYAALLATVSSEGKLLRTRKLSAQTRWLIPIEDGWFAMGTYYPHKSDLSGAQVTVARGQRDPHRTGFRRGQPQLPLAGALRKHQLRLRVGQHRVAHHEEARQGVAPP